MSDTTATHPANVAAALHTTAPGLAALHAARHRLLNAGDSDQLTPLHCRRCGSYGVLTRTSSSGIQRRKQRTTVQRTCSVCGHTAVDHIDKAVASSLSSTTTRRTMTHSLDGQAHNKRDRAALPTSATTPLQHNETPIATPKSTAGITIPDRRPGVVEAPSKSTQRRQKKRPGLQEMLARSREQQRQSNAPANSLSDFLSGL